VLAEASVGRRGDETTLHLFMVEHVRPTSERVAAAVIVGYLAADPKRRRPQASPPPDGWRIRTAVAD
jgi:hypothetical protein